jgi:hypothetical protein
MQMQVRIVLRKVLKAMAIAGVLQLGFAVCCGADDASLRRQREAKAGDRIMKHAGIKALFDEGYKVQCEEKQVDGKWVYDGICSVFDRNGKLAFQTSFKDGILDGFEKCWHENGKLASESFIKDGKLVGVSREWNELGVKIREVPHKGSIAHGLAITWDDQGNTNSISTWVDGNLIKRDLYKNNRLVKTLSPDDVDKIIDEQIRAERAEEKKK